MFERFDDDSGRLPQPSGWNDPSYRLAVIVPVVVLIAVNEVRAYFGLAIFDRVTGIALGVVAGTIAFFWYARRILKRAGAKNAVTWWITKPRSPLEWLVRVVGIATMSCITLAMPRWSFVVQGRGIQFWLFYIGLALLTLYLYLKHRLDGDDDTSDRPDRPDI